MNVTYFWHCRLGHISESRINKLYKEEFFDLNNYESLETYKSCLVGNMTKTPFSEYEKRTSELLVLVHIDIYGPITTQARRRYSYLYR